MRGFSDGFEKKETMEICLKLIDTDSFTFILILAQHRSFSDLSAHVFFVFFFFSAAIAGQESENRGSEAPRLLRIWRETRFAGFTLVRTKHAIFSFISRNAPLPYFFLISRNTPLHYFFPYFPKCPSTLITCLLVEHNKPMSSKQHTHIICEENRDPMAYRFLE